MTYEGETRHSDDSEQRNPKPAPALTKLMSWIQTKLQVWGCAYQFLCFVWKGPMLTVPVV
jgi:hypothetical protein